MTKYYPYDPQSKVTVTEQATIASGTVTLRHIPKSNSIVINNFAESSSANPAQGSFFCDYSDETFFRDSNRQLIFNSADNGKTITIKYTACGTVFTADDANEIKAHMENTSIHGPFWRLIGTIYSRPSDEDEFTCDDYSSHPDFATIKRNGQRFYPEAGDVLYFESNDAYWGFNGTSWEKLNNRAARMTTYDSGSTDRLIGDIWLGNNGLYIQTEDGEVRIDTPEDIGSSKTYSFDAYYFDEFSDGTIMFADGFFHYNEGINYPIYDPDLYFRQGEVIFNGSEFFLRTSRDFNDRNGWTPLYSLPTASEVTTGGVKVGSGLKIDNGVLSVDLSTDIETYDKYTTVEKGSVRINYDLWLAEPELYLALQSDPDTWVKVDKTHFYVDPDSFEEHTEPNTDWGYIGDDWSGAKSPYRSCNLLVETSESGFTYEEAFIKNEGYLRVVIAGTTQTFAGLKLGSGLKIENGVLQLA